MGACTCMLAAACCLQPFWQCMRTTMSAMVKRFLASATRILLTRSLHSLLTFLDMGQEYSAARRTPNQTGILWRVKCQLSQIDCCTRQTQCWPCLVCAAWGSIRG